MTIPRFNLQSLTSFLPTRRTQPVFARGPLDPLGLRFSICWLHWPLKAGTNSKFTLPESYVGICKYDSITLIISVQPPKWFRLFTQVCPVQRNLCLMDWSWVNMQHSPTLLMPLFLTYLTQLTNSNTRIFL